MKEVSKSAIIPFIKINIDSMEIDCKSIILDNTENPFNDFGLAIVDNLVEYTSLEDEEKEET